MKNPIKIIRAWNINRKQADLNEKYELYGLTDELLEKQVAINRKRNKHGIVDKDKIIHEDFVQ